MKKRVLCTFSLFNFRLHSLTDLLFPNQSDIIDSLSETLIGKQILVLSLRYSNIYLFMSEIDLEKPDSRILLRYRRLIILVK